MVTCDWAVYDQSVLIGICGLEPGHPGDHEKDLDIDHHRHVPLTVRLLVNAWVCPDFSHLQPTGCWSSSHLPGYEVKRMADACTRGCVCWRHAVVVYLGI